MNYLYGYKGKKAKIGKYSLKKWKARYLGGNYILIIFPGVSFERQILFLTTASQALETVNILLLLSTALRISSMGALQICCC